MLVREPAALREPYAFPGGHDLTGLPPPLIFTADIDSLRASGQQYGAEFAGAGADLVMIREVGSGTGTSMNRMIPQRPAASIASRTGFCRRLVGATLHGHPVPRSAR
jgi:acetyl esterase/lipase